ncbi:hypothetical protein BC940DRAFT_323914 [Gongronella butleri]|nr:hypothetical protein BC940DRAFT_323914 [Gongronella butleri]
MALIENDAIPGPVPYVLFGNAPDLLPDLVGNIRKLHEKHGPVVKLTLDGKALISTWDPDGMRQVLEENDCFTKSTIGLFSDLALLNGRGLITIATSDRDWNISHNVHGC